MKGAYSDVYVGIVCLCHQCIILMSRIFSYFIDVFLVVSLSRIYLLFVLNVCVLYACTVYLINVSRLGLRTLVALVFWW